MSIVEQEDQGQERVRIMLLGKSGAGKSSSGNTILNKLVFKSDMKLKRITSYCEKEDGTVEDTPVSVIDTPGLFEKDTKKEVTVREILKRVKLQEPGPHVFVCVIPLGRMTQEDQNTNMLIENMFGPRVWDYTMVLFTHGDRLEGKTINDVITESDENLRNFIRKCSGGFHVFNNKNLEDQMQVMRFMEKIQTLMALNGGGYYKTELYPKQERKIRERQQDILSERNEDISKKETQLKEHFQDKELNTKIRDLWRNEEEDARKAAERKSVMAVFFSKGSILLVLLVCLLIAWALQVSVGWLIPATIIWMVLFLTGMFPSIPEKMSWLEKKMQ
ncbi:GTPase IMAP family member 7-like [Brachyistius frenatus]|uniref:GTPase IMAP family member 7-like n=1 Tax=Brachyistius frenatus TaxID=100188 RepID=UPI0037E7B17F